MKSLTKITAIAAVMLSAPVGAQDKLTSFERYEESQGEERALTLSLAKKFMILQENSKHEGKKVRGTHSKGTCMDGSFEVYDHITDQYKVGLFAASATYPARVRFANGASTVQADYVPDARAISVSLDLGNGEKQEFAMNNGPTFPIGNLTDFNFLLDVGFVKGKALKEALASGKSMEEAESDAKRASMMFLAKHPVRAVGFAKTIRRGAHLRNQEVDSYRNLKYWSGSAFKYGDDQVAKFAFSPCKRTLNGQPDKSDPDYLQKDIINAVNSDNSPICFDFQVQLLDADKMRYQGTFSTKKLPAWQWVEDVTLDWDDAGATFYTVGRLTLTPHSIYDKSTCDDPANGIDVMKHSLPEHRGLGRINRARARAESASRNNRS